jgi:hypothetical protein
MEEELMRNLISSVCALAFLGSVAVFAQTETAKTKTKVKVDGKDITVSGCIAAGSAGGFVITSRQGDAQYTLVGGHDLDKHVGHQVEIKGETTDDGHGKVKVKSKEKASNADTTHDRAEIKGDVHALSVKSLKMISSSCS